MAIRNNPFRPLIKKIPAPLRNKYFLVLTVFIAWLVFFDKHDILTQWRLQQTLNKMEEDKAFYLEKTEEVQQDRVDIIKDKEKFAREHYQMKKSDEDVFILVEE